MDKTRNVKQAQYNKPEGGDITPHKIKTQPMTTELRCTLQCMIKSIGLTRLEI